MTKLIFRFLICVGAFAGAVALREGGFANTRGPKQEKPSFLTHSARFKSALDTASRGAGADRIGDIVSNARSISIPGSKVGHLSTVLPGEAGRFYIMDGANQHLYTFHDSDGQLQPLGRKGSGPGSYVWPTGLSYTNKPAAGGAPDLWFTDFRQSRINRITLSGEYVSSFPISEQPYSAKGIVQDPSTGELHVCGNLSQGFGRTYVLHDYTSDGTFEQSRFELPRKALELNLDAADDCYFTTAGQRVLVAFPFDYKIYSITHDAITPILSKAGDFAMPTAPLVFPNGPVSDKLRAYDDWTMTFTPIRKIVAPDANTLLVQYQTFSPLRYRVDMWDLRNSRLIRSAATNYRMLDAAPDGRVFFLKNQESSEQPTFEVMYGSANQ
ncbi:MAG TPA: hypothetical protein VIX89_02940 [Bryobacteraceae bacterium]